MFSVTCSLQILTPYQLTPRQISSGLWAYCGLIRLCPLACLRRQFNCDLLNKTDRGTKIRGIRANSISVCNLRCTVMVDVVLHMEAAS
ncbi:hypothetical protein TNCV_3209191 [Trichonephila clavipes]|nr:hypothetical protein TNCV_3209191 [Trichonephila clavipes]